MRWVGQTISLSESETFLLKIILFSQQFFELYKQKKRYNKQNNIFREVVSLI